MLLNPGDEVWFENPGAIGARNSFIACGAELVPVPVDREGIAGRGGAAARPQFRLAFVTPSHQQPLGNVMSLERRFALLRAAEQAGAWIIEDDYDGEFFYGGRPLADLEERRPHRARDLCRDLQQVAVSGPAPRLHPGAAVADRDLRDVHRSPSCTGVADEPAGGGRRVHGGGLFRIRTSAACAGSTRSATTRLYAAAQRELGGLLERRAGESGLHTIGDLAVDICPRSRWRAPQPNADIMVSPIARFSLEPTGVTGSCSVSAASGRPRSRAGIERAEQGACAALRRTTARGRRSTPRRRGLHGMALRSEWPCISNV